MESSTRSLEVSCSHLDLLRSQFLNDGHITLNPNRQITRARKAILDAIAPGGLVRLKYPDSEDVLEIPTVDHPFHQRMIHLVREKGEESSCWWRKVGCAITDTVGNILDLTHNDPVGEGNFCKGLEIKNQEVIKLLTAGERLEFCHARHAEATMVSKAARAGVSIAQKNWYLSLEPCDHCANLIVGVDPVAVYIDFDLGTKKYYHSLGIEILLSAKIPTYLVRMPEDGST